jgi:glycerol uptake facilitator-like aquaporin
MSARELARRLTAEALGAMFLLVAVVGSGIMGERLAGGNDAIALLANSLATGGALVALIAALGPISGAHLNPAVTMFECARGRIAWRTAVFYIPVQIVGAVAGVLVAHAMFALPLIQVSTHARDSGGELIGEIVATLGLLLTIWGVARSRPESMPYAVAAYITGAYWFTSSTSFANPAVTLARGLTDTFAGIAPASIAGFVAAEIVGLALALVAAWGLGANVDARPAKVPEPAPAPTPRTAIGLEGKAGTEFDLLPPGCSGKADCL